MYIFIYCTILIFLALNTYVIVKLLGSDYFSKKQKMAQVIFIFVLPFLGAFIVWYLIKDTGKKLKPSKGKFGGGNAFDITYPW